MILLESYDMWATAQKPSSIRSLANVEAIPLQDPTKMHQRGKTPNALSPQEVFFSAGGDVL